MPRSISAQVTADTPVVTTAETVAVTVGPVDTRFENELVHISAVVQVTAGVGTTTVTPRIRRGTGIAGPVVGEGNPVTLAAGQTAAIPVAVDDVPGNVSGQQYAVTVQQAAATGNGTILSAEAHADIGA